MDSTNGAHAIHPDERALIQRLLSQDIPAKMLLPEPETDAECSAFFAQLDLFCRTYLQIRRVHSQVKPLLGRALLIVRGRPDLYQSKGFQGFEEFLNKWVMLTFEISRSECYNALRIAERTPSWTTEQYAQVGITKLSKLAPVLNADASPEAVRSLVEEASRLTVPQVIAMVEARAGLPRAAQHKSEIRIDCTDEDRRRWEEFSADGRVQQIVGSAAPGAILCAMIEECGTEWVRKVEENQHAERFVEVVEAEDGDGDWAAAF